MSEEKDSSGPDEEKGPEENSPPVELEQPKRRFDPERLGAGNGDERADGDDAIYATTCMAIGFSIMLPM